MTRHGLPILLASLSLGACAGDAGPPPPPEAAGPAQSSEVVFQAVDAGTGSALTDAQLTVRYLVRTPITLDAAGVERVTSAEPYRIAHEVATDSLVVEVRLEAASYHRLDTVLAVARGGTAGPLTVRLSRRLEAGAAPTRTATASAPAGGRQPAADPAGSATSATVDRGPLEAGNRAFGQGNWLAAVEAYGRMTDPPDASGAYAADYALALVNKGIAHINRGEYGAALEALETASEYDPPGWAPSAYLAQAQCAVGRTEEGRGTLAILGRQINRMPTGERPVASAMTEYQRGLCSAGEFDRAQDARDRIRTGGQAIRELQAFIQQGEAVSAAPPALQQALAAAAERIQLIQTRIRGD